MILWTVILNGQPKNAQMECIKMGNSISFFSVMMIVPCHHGMARPQVADG
jgi:hypothetical protein